MSNLKSPFLRVMAPWVGSVQDVMKMLGVYEFMPSNQMMVDGGKLACMNESPFQEVCANALFLLCGFNSAQFNRSLLPTILESTPAGKWTSVLRNDNCYWSKLNLDSFVLGASVDQLIHYAQGINSRKFRMFDFGLAGNLFRYGSFSPPDYNLRAITAPVFLHYSDNDWMVAAKDVDELAAKLGNCIGKFRVPDPKFNHLDFTYATDADTLLYERIISYIKAF